MRNLATLALILATANAASAQQVVNNPAPNPNAPTYRISAQPEVTFGGQNDRSPAGDLWQVVDVVTTSTGNFVVSYAGGTKVGVVSPRGQILRSLGRSGDGPGEYRRVDQLFVMPGDTIVLNERLRGRVHYLSEDDRFIRQTSGARQPECCLRDGSFISRPGSGIIQATPENWQSKVETWKVSLVSGRSPAADDRPLFEAQGNDPVIYLAYPNVMSADLSEPGMLFDVPYRRRAMLRAANDAVVFGRGDAFEYSVYSATGSLLRTVRAGGAPAPLTSEQKAEARSSIADRKDPAHRRMLEAAVEKVVFPTTGPSYDRMHTTPDGTVWLRAYRSEYRAANSTPHWWVRFDPAGKMLGTMQLPPDIVVTRFTNDRVILQRANGDGFATIMVHRIERIAGQ